MLEKANKETRSTRHPITQVYELSSKGSFHCSEDKRLLRNIIAIGLLTSYSTRYCWKGGCYVPTLTAYLLFLWQLESTKISLASGKTKMPSFFIFKPVLKLFRIIWFYEFCNSCILVKAGEWVTKLGLNCMLKQTEK